MKTPREYYPKNAIMYTFEQESCPQCEGKLNVAYTSKARVVQTMGGVMAVAHRAKYCLNADCVRYQVICKSGQWQQIAPSYCT